MAKKLTEKLKVDLTCPGCGASFKVTLAQVQAEESANCPGCQKPIKLRSAGDDISGIDRAVEKLRRTFKEINRKNPLLKLDLEL